MRVRSSRTRLSDILINAGLIDAEGLARALDRQKMQPGRLGSQLLKLGLVTEDNLAKGLSIQFGVPPFLPAFCEIEASAVERLPQPTARRCRALPFMWEPDRGTLHVVMADPQDLRAVDEVRFASGARKIAVQVAPETTLERLISRHYDGVEVPAAAAPEISVALPQTATPRPTDPGEPAGKVRLDVLLADPNPRRRRAMAGLLESSGFRITRAATLEEAAELIARRPWSGVWVHEEWKECGAGSADLHIYADPVAALEDAAGPLEALRREALDVAELAGQQLLGKGLPAGKKSVALVRFLAARRGIEGVAVDCLALRAWRAVLCGWEAPGALPSMPGNEIVAAVTAYERAMLAGGSPGEVAETLRKDPSLDSNAVTSLIRWAVGEDLLSRFEAPPRALVILPPDLREQIAAHLTGSGWQVTTGDTESPMEGSQGVWDAVLAEMGSGLPFLEKSSRLPQEKRAPVFLFVDNLNSPDTMYALKLGAEDVLPFDTHPEVLETKLRRAASRRAPGQGLVTGNLRDMGLADMLQILSNGLKTAVVRVGGPAGAGEVALQQGAIVDARLGGLEGEEALYAMIAWEEGDFRIVPGEPARAATLAGSTEGLLMEGFRRIDEARRYNESDELPEC